MRQTRSAILSLAAVLAFMQPAPFAQAPEPRPVELPSHALIPGVPFVSWRDGARLDYQDKEILNPSFASSLGMILKYWGQDLKLLQHSEAALPKGPSGWAIVKEGEATSLEEVKSFVAQGIPVLVSPALTPVAHTPNPAIGAMATMLAAKEITIQPDGRASLTRSAADRYGQLVAERGGPSSGVLGKMEPLETFRSWEDLLRRPAWESLFMSARVVIGYDDDRRTVTLHDPSFGPAWEVSYEDFEKMWQPRQRWYVAARPANYVDVVAKNAGAGAYKPRTADQRAAEHFVYGYALSSIGRATEAEAEIKRGLAVAGVTKGYEHLLMFELAQLLLARGNTDEAIAAGRRATELIPEHHRPWKWLAQAYRGTLMEGREQKATDAESKARSLCSDRRAQQTVARMLAQDFSIFGCEPLKLLGPAE
jgi:tetratricopeptide (TPR) repeat protein